MVAASTIRTVNGNHSQQCGDSQTPNDAASRAAYQDRPIKRICREVFSRILQQFPGSMVNHQTVQAVEAVPVVPAMVIQQKAVSQSRWAGTPPAEIQPWTPMTSINLLGNNDLLQQNITHCYADQTEKQSFVSSRNALPLHRPCNSCKLVNTTIWLHHL